MDGASLGIAASSTLPRRSPPTSTWDGMGVTRRSVTIENVRRLAVSSQRLSGRRPSPVKTDDIHDLVLALGCLQLDPTAIVARNHLLVVFSRLGPFDPALLETLLWAHQASIVATDDRALHLAAPPRWGVLNQTTGWMTQRAGAVDVVLARLATAGVVRASDFVQHTEKYESGWGARSEIADTIALLWLSGRIVPAGRDGRGRRWVDADTWFGAAITDLPLPHDAVRAAAVRSLRALGIATKQQVRKHFIRNRYLGLDAIWTSLEGDGEIVPVDPGIRGDWYMHATDVDRLQRLEAGAFEPRTTLLSPFDNLICDRARTLALWGFDFRLEIYVPRSKRWGYFVMPLLHGDRLCARFDLAVDRTAGRLLVIGQRWEPGWEGRRRPAGAVRRALGELARFAGVEAPSAG
jgi:uncharacterized protein YcaQ